MKKITRELRTLAEMRDGCENDAGEVTFSAYERALDWVRAMNALMLTETCLGVDTWREALADIGIRARIDYSGFHVQGSGASFTGEATDIRRLVAFLRNPPKGLNQIASVNGRERWAPWIVSYARIDGPYLRADDAEIEALLADGDFSLRFERTCHRYAHENTVSIRPWDYPEGVADDFVRRFERAVESFRIDVCRAIYRYVEAEYEHAQSVESCHEDAEANEWHFDAETGCYVKC